MMAPRAWSRRSTSSATDRGVFCLERGQETLKWIGKASREELTELLGRSIHLFLHVKVRAGWAEDRGVYRDMGLDFDV